MRKIVLSVFHTSDIHGKFNSKKVNKIKDLLDKCDISKILVDSGDILKGGNVLFYPFEKTFKYIDELKYTAICLGNREFNYFRPVFYSRLRKYPFLACNVIDKFFKEQKINPSLHLVVDSIRLTIVGVTKPQYPPDSFWEKLTSFRFERTLDSISKQIELYYKITDLFIILSHLGIRDDLVLAEFIFNNYTNITSKCLILGGHDHRDFFSDDFIPVIHTSPFLQRLTHLELFFNVNKNSK
ncbi:MAG: metallophosphoesterase, partial [Candidatus Calescibacterium sp.]|nr:metallophosphoesterase [Candidatus Calescibacterium sp.]